MRTCPACGAVYADEEAFCELDGTALAGEGPSSGTITVRAPRRCAGCGALVTDDGHGRCAACGRLVSSAPAPMPPRAQVGPWTVGDARGMDDFATNDGDRVAVLAVGGREALGYEARAVALLADAADGAFPRVLDRGEDERWGAYVVLAAPPPGARLLVEVGPTMEIAAALRTIAKLLDLAERIERAGLDWTPLRDDAYLDARGELRLARLRGARPLAPQQRIDARYVVEAFGAAFLPLPGVHGSTRLVRFLSAHALGPEDRAFTLEAERAELAAIEAIEEAARRGARDADAPAFVVCDPGMKRPYNEDAGAVAWGEARGEPWAVLAVCDGVSASSHAGQAATIAASTACETLARIARSGELAALDRERAAQAVATAVRAAHVAICAQRLDCGGGDPPGTTIVVALVQRDRATVGWVGDSRAYWISGGRAELLTRDHSWVNETVARGEMTEEEALRQPLAHALTRCLGPLEAGEGYDAIDGLDLDALGVFDGRGLEAVEPDVCAYDLDGPGLLVVCTDGLWNYFPRAGDLARVIEAAMLPSTAARLLVNHALERGGHDNVTVAVYARR